MTLFSGVPPGQAPPGQASIKRAHAMLRDWMNDHALAFWSSTGCDPRGLGFIEHLNLEGQPASVSYKRVRVQARQIYVFSHAALLGWPDAVAPAKLGFAFMIDHALQEDGSWARRVGADGGVADGTADLYDLAFVLFALAWYGRATASDQAIQLAYATARWLRDRMAHPAGGFLNTLPREAGPRQQNPHMHLLEAMLALYETTQDTFFLDLASDLVALFQTQFYDPVTQTLGEFFEEDWSRPTGDADGNIEPGHHYEWVWLLHEFARLTRQTVPKEVLPLYRFANRFGVDPASGLVIDMVDRQGRWRDASARLWPQTEAIKAHLVMSDTDAGGAIEAERATTNLIARFLTTEPRGTWIEHRYADGKPKADKIPSSSFYHIHMAFGELDKAVKAQTL